MPKTFWVTVIDESQQSLRIMDVVGYSHMGQPYKISRAGQRITVRRACITGWSNRTTLQQVVKQTLGDAYWSGLNIVEPA